MAPERSLLPDESRDLSFVAFDAIDLQVPATQQCDHIDGLRYRDRELVQDPQPDVLGDTLGQRWATFMPTDKHSRNWTSGEATTSRDDGAHPRVPWVPQPSVDSPDLEPSPACVVRCHDRFEQSSASG